MFPKINIEIGMYQEAEKQGKDFNQFLEDLQCEKEGEISIYKDLSPIEVIKLKKKLNKGLVGRPLTALEKQLMLNDIKAYNDNTDTVDKFYSTSTLTALFPAFISDHIYGGLVEKSPVRSLIMFENTITSTQYQKIRITTTEDKRQLKRTAEGAELRETMISLAKENIKLYKFGTYLSATYETLKNQRLNIFGKSLEMIGLQMAVDEMDEFITTCINGDGNSNSIDSAKTLESLVFGAISIDDVIAISNFQTSPFKAKALIGKKALMNTYYSTVAQMQVQRPIETLSSIGVDIPRSIIWDRSVVTADWLISVDTDYAIELVNMGPTLIETEKVIKKQIEGAAISKWSGFAIHEENGITTFDCTHA